MNTRVSALADPKKQFMLAALALTLLLAGIQGWMLIAALTSQVNREPADIRSAAKRIGELTALRQAQLQHGLADPEEMPARFAVTEGVGRAAGKTLATLAPEVVNDTVVLEPILLPGLTGILQEQDIAGGVRLRACFAEGVFAVGDKVGGFRLIEVTPEKVVLFKGGGRYVLKAEKPGLVPVAAKKKTAKTAPAK